MNYDILKTLIDDFKLFEIQNKNNSFNINDFVGFLSHKYQTIQDDKTVNWQGKENGRSSDSIINTMIIHLSKYAKNYSKSIIKNTYFSTQDEFIFLINLDIFGEMTKMELIQKNVQDKPSGMLIINRLIEKGWVRQTNSTTDKRSKNISISELGKQELKKLMPNIRKASQIVTANLTETEKLQLIELLQKLEVFHNEIYLYSNEKDNLIELAFEKLQYN
jgi:DNA-binding MarR family transcriptional regulator